MKNIGKLAVVAALVLALSVAAFSGCAPPSGNTTSSADTSGTVSDEVSSNTSSEASSNTSSEASSTPTSSVSSTVSTIDPNHPYAHVIEAVANLDNTRHGYGFGYPVDGNNRPILAQDQQKEYGKHGMTAITDDTAKIYLTFDEGYEYGNNTTKILDVLKEKGVTATFFVTMHYVKANPHLVRRMINEGHIVGNHSVNHPDMTTVTTQRAINEIMDLHNYVLEHFGYEMKLFRPPTGAYSVKSLEIAKQLGYRTVEWSWTYSDWDTDNQLPAIEALNKVKNSTHGGAIYLLHAVSTTNTEILADVIDYWRGEGYYVEAYPNISPNESTSNLPTNPPAESSSSSVTSQEPEQDGGSESEVSSSVTTE